MSDDSAIAAEIAALSGDDVISDGCARAIAAQWHSPADPALTALSTTGAIVDGVSAEIDGAVTETTVLDDLSALQELSRYVDYHGTRGPVDDQPSLWVR